MLDAIERAVRDEMASESGAFSPLHNAGNRKHYFANIVFAQRLQQAALLPGNDGVGRTAVG